MRSVLFASLVAVLMLGPGVAVALPAIPADPVDSTQTATQTVRPVPARSALQMALENRLLGDRAAELRFREAMVAFYEDRDFRPVWVADGALTPEAIAVRTRLADAAADGLDPDAYRITEPMLDTGPHPAAPDLPATELALSQAVMAFARDAQAGRVDPKRISSIITIQPPVPDALVSLKRVASASDPAAALEAFNPPYPEFKALKAALAAERASSAEQPLPVPRGRNLRLGDRDERVGLLRHRLGVTLQRGSDVSVYDADLVEAVKSYQKDHGLRPDGIVGPNTLSVLNRGLERDLETDLLVNMERWRWMPRELGTSHVFVNIPEYQVRIRRDGVTAYQGRVIVGKPGNSTPIFSDEIEHIVVNPYWNVPYSIAKNEMLSSIRQNPSGYFAKRGYEAVYKGRVVNPASVSWTPDMLRQVRIRQKPGRGNALGTVKFMFPNQHAVYLHDTSSRSLFERQTRALSHGCVRVDQPFEFADALLAEEPHWNGSQLKRLVGGSERYVNLERHIPVHLAYFTLQAEEDGTLTRFADIYGYDRRIAAHFEN